MIYYWVFYTSPVAEAIFKANLVVNSSDWEREGEREVRGVKKRGK